MVHRTERRLDDALAVVHCLDWAVHLDAAHAARENLQVKHAECTVYLFDPGEREFVREMFVFVTTPDAVFEEWREHLTPPIHEMDQPLFDLPAWERALGSSFGSLVVDRGDPAENGGLPSLDEMDEDEPFFDEESEPMRVLANVDHLDRDTIERAVALALREVLPHTGSRYSVVWEQTYPSAYVEALVRRRRMLSRAGHAPDRETFRMLVAEADRFHFEHVLPLELLVQETRLMSCPEYVEYMQTGERAEYDEWLMNGPEQRGPEGYFNSSLGEFDEAGEIDLFEDVADPALLYARLKALQEYEVSYPELGFRSALEWLEERMRWRPGGKG